MKLSLILEAIDRATAPIAKVERSVDRLSTGAFRRVESAMTRVANVSQRVLDAPLLQRFGQFDQRVTKLITTGGRWALEKGAYATGAAIGFTLRKVGELLVRVSQLAVVGGVAALGFLTKGVFQTGIQFEQLQIALETTEGSSKKAKAALDWIENFAVKTPYELDQVAEAFKQLRVLDFNPMQGTLEALGNAASAMSRPLGDAVAALASAAAGEFEPLRSFGIRISKQGQQLTLSYRQNGKEFRKVIRDNQAELEKAVTSVFNTRFPAMMNKQSASFAGVWSNILDGISKFERMIADAGIFDLVKQKLQGILAWLDEQAKNGNLKLWAQQISDWMGLIVKNLGELTKPGEWQKLVKNIEDIGEAIGTVAHALIELKKAGDGLAGFLNGIQDILGKAGDGASRTPGALLLRGAANALAMTGLIRAPGSSAGAKPTPLPSPRPNFSPKGKIEITVKSAPGISARPTKVDNGGWDWELYSGRAMRPF